MNEDEKKAIEEVSGNLGSSGRTEGRKLEATYKLNDSINQLQASIIQFRKSIGSEVENLTNALDERSKSEKSLQKWLLIWTSIMAIATVVQVIVYYYK